MGFPVGYSELLLPRMFLHLIFLLGHVRRLISWLFEAVGLGDLLLDSDFSPSSAGDSPPYSEYHRGHHHHHGHHRVGGEFRSASAMLIQEMLPVARVGELRAEGWDLPDACAVCLHELEAGDEARRLSNCRHVFHRCCLDRWTEHDQHTCPLCRTPLVPDDLRDAFDQRLWAAAGVPDSSYFLYSSYYDDDGGDADGLDYSPPPAADQHEAAGPDPLLHRPSPHLMASAS